MKKIDNSVHLYGIDFFSGTMDELLKIVRFKLENSSKVTYINTPNPEQIIQTRGNQQFLSDLQAADISVPDGAGLVWASQALSLVRKVPQALSERISGADLAQELLLLAQEHRWRVLIVGGEHYHLHNWVFPWVKSVTMTDDYSSSNLWQLAASPEVWWTPGYQKAAHPTKKEEKEVAEVIFSLKPDIVFVAFGAPYQERWVVSHLEACQKAGTTLMVVVGGAFDYFLGKVPRAPRFLRVTGFEWLFRLTLQPWRWRRQLRLAQFIGLVFRQLASAKTLSK